MLRTFFLQIAALLSSQNTNMFGHGTAVIMLLHRDAIVVAADGHRNNSREANGSIQQFASEAAQKIVACNGQFLCGTAGKNPFMAFGIKYDFQQWIASHKLKGQASVRKYAVFLQKQVWLTFHNIEKVPANDEFWKDEISNPSEFIAYGIVGWNGNDIELCAVLLRINPQTRRLVSPPVDCHSKSPPLDPSRFILVPLPTTFHKNIDLASIENTP